MVYSGSRPKDAIRKYFPMPNAIFNLSLNAGEISVYAYLLFCENRKTYQCYPSFAAIGKAFAWSSSNPEVATVVDGVVTPLTAGMTTVTAVSNDGDFSASCLITVTDPGVPVRKGQSTAVPVPHHPIAPLSQNRPGGRKNQSRPKRHWPGQQSRKYLPEACQLSADILHADYLDDLRPCPGIRLHALPRQSPPGPDGFLYIPL